MFGSVYLAKDLSNGKHFIVKEYKTRGNFLKIQELLVKETLKLEKVRKFKHPNLQNLITWFKDPHGTIVTVREFRKG